MRLPTWLKAPLTIALGLVFRNNKIPVDMAPAVVDGMFPSLPQKPRSEDVAQLDLNLDHIELQQKPQQ